MQDPQSCTCGKSVWTVKAAHVERIQVLKGECLFKLPIQLPTLCAHMLTLRMQLFQGTPMLGELGKEKVLAGLLCSPDFHLGKG